MSKPVIATIDILNGIIIAHELGGEWENFFRAALEIENKRARGDILLFANFR